MSRVSCFFSDSQCSSPDLYRGFAPGPLWETSVSQVPWLGPSPANPLHFKILTYWRHVRCRATFGGCLADGWRIFRDWCHCKPLANEGLHLFAFDNSSKWQNLRDTVDTTYFISSYCHSDHITPSLQRASSTSHCLHSSTNSIHTSIPRTAANCSPLRVPQHGTLFRYMCDNSPKLISDNWNLTFLKFSSNP